MCRSSDRAGAGTSARAVRALVMVSCVVNVLDATMNSVVSGSQRAQRLGDVRAIDVGHEVQGADRSRGKGASASVTITGPRSEPPMPMLTTSVMRLPV